MSGRDPELDVCITDVRVFVDVRRAESILRCNGGPFKGIYLTEERQVKNRRKAAGKEELVLQSVD